ncbi:hypothetical protein STEG23_014091 [Scotinomys teguina]
MKWVTFLLLLFVCSSALSRGVFRRDAPDKSEIAHWFKDLGEQHFKGLVLVTLAQHLQKCPYEEHMKLVNEITEFAKTCVADESAANCNKMVARMSQKFPDAEFTEISKLATDITKITQECCHGDLLECADDRADLAKYMCENQASISSKLQACCDKPVLQKSHSILMTEHDDMPADLPSLANDFVEDSEVWKNYAEAKDILLDKFLYELSRRHPDYSVTLLLRIAMKFEATLEKCCAEADLAACYGEALDELRPLVEESKNLVKTNCELFEKLGEYGFQNVSSAEIHLDEDSEALGLRKQDQLRNWKAGCDPEPCVLHEKTPVSEQVTKCCTGSVVERRPCFSALPVDETYVPKEFIAETFTFHADICTLMDHEKQIKKQT